MELMPDGFSDPIRSVKYIIALLVYLIYDLRWTEQNLAESLISNTKINTELELGRYFSSAG